MSTLPAGCIVKVFSLIREAADKDMSNTDKSEWVLDQLKNEYPSVGTNMLNALIELAYRAVNRGLV